MPRKKKNRYEGAARSKRRPSLFGRVLKTHESPPDVPRRALRTRGAPPRRYTTPKTQVDAQGNLYSTDSWSWKATQTPPQTKRLKNRARNKRARAARRRTRRR